MAKRKRTAAKRRRTTTKRRPGVRLVRRGTTVYQGNPKRRRGKRRSVRRYGRNPGILTGVIQIAKNSGAVLVGGAAGRIVGNMLPSFGNPIADAAKGALVAYGIHYAGKRFLGADMAAFLAAGAMQVPLKTLITGFVPQAAAFLGDDMGAYSLASYADVAGLPDGADGMGEVEVGSYSEVYG